MADDLQELLGQLPAGVRERLFADVTAQVGEQRLASDLDRAVDAYRADRSEANKVAYQQATEALRVHRELARAGRTGVGVGGNTFVSG